MPENRFFCDSLPILHEKTKLTEKEHHHLSHVMRLKVGQEIELINGKGVLAKAKIEVITRNNTILLIENIEQKPVPKIDQILAQGIPRMNRLEWIIEKGTELGVTEFLLMPTERSEKPLSLNKLERLKSISISAIKQSGRLYLPKISITPPLLNWSPPQMPLFFGDLSENAPPLKDQKINSNFLWITGPESGLSQKEEDYLRTHGAVGVNLHQNILRTDTASIVALSLLCQ